MINMSKKKHEEVEEEEVAPFWMISFSDLMTLLLSFFIILFSISTIEEKKMAELVEAMGNRYLPIRGRLDSKRSSGEEPIPESLKIEQKEKTTTSGTIIPFAMGNTDLDERCEKILDRLAEELLASSLPIVIRGHASNAELEQRPSGVVDDLAYERVWNVRKHLETFEIDHKRFILVIIGPNEPLSHAMLSPDFGDENTYVEVMIQEASDVRY